MESVIVVNRSGEPIEDVDVVVSTAAGEIVEHVKTAADGQALVDVPEDGSVTVAHSFTTIENSQTVLWRNLNTAVGLADGGTFHLEQGPGTPWDPPTPMTVTVGLSGQCITPPDVAAYQAYLSCRSGSQTQLAQDYEFQEYYGCDGQSTYDVFLLALDSQDKVLRYSVQVDHPYQAGGSAAHHLCPTNTNITETTFTVSDIPPQTNAVGFFLYADRNASNVHNISRGVTEMSPAVTVADFLRLPTSELSVFGHSISVGLTPGGELYYSSVSRWSTNLSAQPTTVSMSVSEFAYVESLPVADLSEVERPKIAWDLSSAGALGDVINVRLAWFPTEHERTYWRVVHPAQRNSEVQLPSLPTALSEFPPGIGDTIGQTLLQHIDFVGVEGLAPCLEGTTQADGGVQAEASHYPP